jgi:hypothetical protein
MLHYVLEGEVPFIQRGRGEPHESLNRICITYATVFPRNKEFQASNIDWRAL